MSLWINFSEKQQEISYRDLTFLGESSLLYVTTLPGLVVIGIVEVWIKCS